MATDNKDASSLPIGNLVLALLAIAGAAVHQWPLESSRPAQTPLSLVSQKEVQDVDARLWQDPLAGIANYRDQQIKAKRDPDGEHTLQRLRLDRCNTLVLGVMVFGGPYFDDSEFRRRTRYAVLSGLDASGYTPDNPDKLGYFARREGAGLPQLVPYEFLNKKKQPKNDNQQKEEKVLVLWLNEDALGIDAPVVKLAGLIEAVRQSAPANCAGPNVKIIGPAGSGFLKELATAVDPKIHQITTPDLPAALKKYEFYSPSATVSWDSLGHNAQSKPARAAENYKIKNSEVTLFRTINDDAEVAAALVSELGQRGIHPGRENMLRGPDHVVLISEWDTFYGQELPKQFANAAVKARCGDTIPDQQCEKAVRAAITEVSYLRGLDGDIRPATAADQAGSNSAKDDKDQTNKKARLERAEGTGQLDYLRRLAARVEERVHEITKSHGGSITAIGVLGSDLYDKLLVLQALRPEFPGAIFFTTDLDARLIDPTQYKWTHNLLVGSGYGLELNSALQRKFPPFRDNYQTSAFFATLLALDKMENKQDKLEKWLDAPRVYEIGRTRAFAFQPPPLNQEHPDTVANSATSKKQSDSDPKGSKPCETLAQCDEIHPPLPDLFPSYHDHLGTLVAAIVGFAAALALLFRYSWWFRSAVTNASPKLWVVLALVVASAIAIMIANGLLPGEPFAWAEGISIWPSELIRLIALLLCCYFIYRAWEKDELQGTARNELGATFFSFGTGRKAAAGNNSGKYRSIFEWFAEYDTRFKKRGDLNFPVDARQLWQEYDQLDARRLSRLWSPMLLSLLVCGGLLIVFGGFPNTPYRGELSNYVNKTLMLVVIIAFIVLLFSVVDSIRLCSTFIYNLSTARSQYPPEVIEHFRTVVNLDSRYSDCYLADWIDICLISRRTEQIGEMIYYPFVILVLLLIARSQIFDYWYWPPGLLVVFLCGFLLAIICEMVLRRASENARSIAVARLNQYILRAKADAKYNETLISCLGTLVDEIKEMRHGIFLPFSQQPLVRALLVVLGSFGGLQVIERFVILGTAF